MKIKHLCLRCRKEFVNEEEFKHHQSSCETITKSTEKSSKKEAESSEGAHQCSKCDRRFNSFYGWKKHRQASEITPCVKSKASSDMSTYHMNSRQAAKPIVVYECKICRIVFENMEGIENHFKEYFSSSGSYCNQCHVTFSSRTALVRHKKNHTLEKVNLIFGYFMSCMLFSSYQCSVMIQ